VVSIEIDFPGTTVLEYPHLSDVEISLLPIRCMAKHFSRDRCRSESSAVGWLSRGRAAFGKKTDFPTRAGVLILDLARETEIHDFDSVRRQQ
jgi:hypothetical protein